ncbi:MAG: hypothetical protein Pars92KO_30010 [Parasphingorhabdus sp.]
MAKKLVSTLAAVITATTATSAIATDSMSFHLKAVVPVTCGVQYSSAGAAFAENVVRLGELREYCNAPGGYNLQVSYSPNSLRGVRLNFGNESVTLDGSGFATIPGAMGPKIQTRALSAQIGENGFDAREFQVAAIAN